MHRNPFHYRLNLKPNRTAANFLSKLVKEKKLKRTPLKDERGSRYSIA